MLEYSIQTPEFQELLDFLKRSDVEFDSPLSAKVDLEEYAAKLWEHSTVVTCRDNGVIIGMINCYTNRPPRGFISNVCVLSGYQGKGVFAKMFSLLCRECCSIGVEEIVLEVNKTNDKALVAYSKIGFTECEDSADSLYMIYEIPRVTVICCAYNHGPYIRQCLDGFVMQKTTFRYEVIVHDDASTDNTAAVIREYAAKYPEIIRPIYQTENQYSRNTGILKTFVYPLIKGKYVAMCEGDDWWTDPLKLQKQVDVLESDPQFSMCCTACNQFVQETGRETVFIASVRKVYTWKELIKRNRITNLTTLVRTEHLVEYDTVLRPQMPPFPMGDYPMWLFMASKGPVIQLPDNTSTYRVLPSSASHFVNPHKVIEFEVQARNVAIWSNRKYGFGKKGLCIRKFNTVWKKSRLVSRKTGANRLSLVLKGLWYAVTHPAPRA